MELQRNRKFLLITLFVIAFALFSAWQREQAPAIKSGAEQAPLTETMPNDVPTEQAAPAVDTPKITAPLVKSEVIDVETDVLKVKIDLEGGDIVRAELRDYPVNQDMPQEGVVLLDKSTNRNFVAQTGLIGKEDVGPDSRREGRAHYTVKQKQYVLNNNKLDVDLHWQNNEGLQVTKTFAFTKGSYLVDVKYNINNQMNVPWTGNFYGQLKQEHTTDKKSGMFGVQMYQGAAVYTPEKPFKKISFKDMDKAPFREQVKGGWAAMMEHYFLSAYIPQENSNNNYYTRADNHVYSIGAISALEVAPKEQKQIEGRFYIGPEVADTLKAISPGLNLTIDYGILWPISQLLFWLLKTINQYIGNWGWSIILVTLIIKLAFYKLSAASYRSMGKMRLLQPRVELLKERYKDDRQQFSAQLMELYKKEKLNPLGGCLPILIQIPVFIALYYVLLESVELRHAPFMFWIKDLSSKDPYYVLPLIMGATMFIQQKMSPPPPDPMQAKMMMLMPVVFTALFLSFPAGLVLYWTVNSILSILQQWYITRSLNLGDGKMKKAT